MNFLFILAAFLVLQMASALTITSSMSGLTSASKTVIFTVKTENGYDFQIGDSYSFSLLDNSAMELSSAEQEVIVTNWDTSASTSVSQSPHVDVENNAVSYTFSSFPDQPTKFNYRLTVQLTVQIANVNDAVNTQYKFSYTPKGGVTVFAQDSLVIHPAVTTGGTFVIDYTPRQKDDFVSSLPFTITSEAIVGAEGDLNIKIADWEFKGTGNDCILSTEKSGDVANVIVTQSNIMTVKSNYVDQGKLKITCPKTKIHANSFFDFDHDHTVDFSALITGKPFHGRYYCTAYGDVESDEKQPTPDDDKTPTPDGDEHPDNGQKRNRSDNGVPGWAIALIVISVVATAAAAGFVYWRKKQQGLSGQQSGVNSNAYTSLV